MARTSAPSRVLDPRRLDAEPGAWRALERRLGHANVYPAGVELFRQSGESDGVYSLAGGLVKLIRLGSDGREFMVGLRARGWILGASAVVLEQPYPVTAMTITPCSLYRMDAEPFRRLLTRDPEFSRYVHQTLGREVHDQFQQVAGLSWLSARQRLQELFCLLENEFGSEQGEWTRIDAPLRQWEMAQLIAVTPPYLSQLLGAMEEEGTIRRDNGWICLRRSPGKRAGARESGIARPPAGEEAHLLDPSSIPAEGV